MVSKIKETMMISSTDTTVLRVMDNSAYFGRSEDRGLRPPKRGDDDKYHVVGNLEILAR
jgi:hypothetical protein